MPSKAPSQNFAFKCGVPGCGNSYPQHEHLKLHGKSHSPVKVTASVNASAKAFKCGVPSCGKSFDDREALLQHGQIHSPTKVNVSVNPAFKCGAPGCGRSFYDHETLLYHGRMTFHSSAKSMKPFFSATGNKPYKCGMPGCGQSFDNHSALLRHGDTHTVCPHVKSAPRLSQVPSPSLVSPPFDGGYTTNGVFSNVIGSQNHLDVLSTLVVTNIDSQKPESMSNMTLGYRNTIPTAFNSQLIVNSQHTPSPPPVSRTPSFFRQPGNVDARASEFNQVTGSQFFIGSIHVGTSPVDLTPRSSSPPPPYKQ